MSAFPQDELQFQAIDENAAWHGLGIVREEGRVIGSGVAIGFGGRHMFVTAGHVIGGCALETLSFMFRPPSSLVRGRPSELSSRYQEIAVTPRVNVPINGLIVADQLDIAFLEVSLQVSEQYRIRFFELTPEAVAPPTGTPVLSCGYPTDLAMPMGGRDKLLVPYGIMAPIGEHPHPERLKGFAAQQSFLIPYALAKNGHARGFSGAPAWFQRPTRELWHPNLGLAGICTHYYEPSGLLSFVKVEEIVRFLQH